MKRYRQERIDYLHQAGKRRKVAHFLKATNFRRLVGGQIYGGHLRRRRMALGIAAMIVIAVGMWFVWQ